MIDCHVHLEKGPYTMEWLYQFIDTAIKRNIDEIYLLEHSHRFIEFMPMYKSAIDYNSYFETWFNKKKSVNVSIASYIDFIKMAKQKSYPIKVYFGLEVCYFEKHEQLVEDIVNLYPFDFITGSIHWIDGFGFDHKKEFWDGIDVDHAYKKYYKLMQKMIKSKLFTIVAHPDSIKVFGHKPSYDMTSTHETLAELLIANDMCAEESGGLYLNYGNKCELGMNKEILHILKDKGVKILTASDAHKPEDVGANIAELLKKK